ncbi:hypothetical protein [Thiomicrorhabdus aquaedulcis]|uniref:hypothetical protein n=1 Tax=Thiomicrorhabdus aquaedulcis TaxID=2211106 RepID=UPI000FD80584|nr:hypothetical protein [Thiomicrorhabdus aquaedulcis]
MGDWMEYLFFDLGLAQRFKMFCGNLNIAAELEAGQTHTGEASFTVKVSDAIDENVLEQLETQYSEVLFGEQAALLDENDAYGALADSCGVQVQLQSGLFTTIAIHPVIMNKILSVLSVDELQHFLNQVAEDIENPKNGPVCARKVLPTI